MYKVYCDFILCINNLAIFAASNAFVQTRLRKERNTKSYMSRRNILKLITLRKKLFPLILLLVCWTSNLIECLLSSTQEVKVSNIITLSSFVYTILTTIVIYRFNHEKK